MKRAIVTVGLVMILGIGLGSIATRVFSAEEELAKGKVLQRAALAGAKGKEVVLVLRELPPGKESGRHYQSGNEVAYILDGSVVLEVEGKPAVTLKAGDSFQTGPRQVHNVKNESATAPVKVLVFYVVNTGKALRDISIPAK
jgi:quercetin dioxygenase-like cupin family protein